MEDGWLAYMNRSLHVFLSEIPKEAIEGGTSTSDLSRKLHFEDMICFSGVGEMGRVQ